MWFLQGQVITRAVRVGQKSGGAAWNGLCELGLERCPESDRTGGASHELGIPSELGMQQRAGVSWFSLTESRLSEM